MKKIIALMALCLCAAQTMEGPKNNNPYASCKTAQEIQKKYDKKNPDLAAQRYLELFEESAKTANFQKPTDFKNTVSSLYEFYKHYPFCYSENIDKKAEEAVGQALADYIERAASAYASAESKMYEKEMSQMLEKYPFNYIDQETKQKISQKIKENTLAIKNGTFKAVVLKQESSLESVSRAKELEEYAKQGYRIERKTIEIIEGGKAKKAQETIVKDKNGTVVAKYSDIFEN